MNEAADTKTYTEQIYTRNGLVKANIFNGVDVLHVGSGDAKLPGTTSIDMLALPNVDIVHNLDQYPWPFNNNSFDLVFGHNVFEHVRDSVKNMEEIWRILRPGGRVVMTMPYFRSTDAFTDPTHKHFFTSQSLDYFLESKNQLSRYGYTDKRFTKIGFWYGWPLESGSVLVGAFKRFIHNHPKFYDRHLSLLFPVKIVVWELEVVKDIV
jgi:SAM-dependent methyltransferase